jgi:murein L,D-transpeptidase YafK
MSSVVRDEVFLKPMKSHWLPLAATVGLAAPAPMPANGQDRPLAQGTTADFVLVQKSRRELTVYRNSVPLRTYRIALGRSPSGAKVREGDHRTPEGDYVIDGRNRRSAFHLSLHVSYPSREDRARARTGGYDPGGDIMIHGLPNGMGWIGHLHRLTDWTRGCMAMTNPEIEELWRVVPNGTPIRIRP